MLGSQGGILGRTFWVPSELIHGVDSVSRNRDGCGFARGGGPVVRLHHAINVGFTGDNNAIIIVMNVQTIEARQETQVLERWVCFRR